MPSQAHILLKKLNKKNQRNHFDADGRTFALKNKIKADSVTNLIDPQTIDLSKCKKEVAKEFKNSLRRGSIVSTFSKASTKRNKKQV
jgi:hypothetical protein